MFGGLAEDEVEGEMTMRALLLFAVIFCFSASAFAQTAAPKVGGKPLKQAKPPAPMGCKLVGTVKGTTLWAGDCAAPRQNFGVPRPSPPRLRQHPSRIPPQLTNNRQYSFSGVCACVRLQDDIDD